MPCVDVVVDPRLSKHLRPHQREGVIFLYECIMQMKDYTGQGAILAYVSHDCHMYMYNVTCTFLYYYNYLSDKINSTCMHACIYHCIYNFTCTCKCHVFYIGILFVYTNLFSIVVCCCLFVFVIV